MADRRPESTTVTTGDSRQAQRPMPEPVIMNASLQRAVTWASALLILAAGLYLFLLGDRPEAVGETSSTMLQIDLNRASEQELALLPQIGPKTAKQIIADRNQNGHFVSLEDLARVHGIGAKTVETIRPYCIVELAGQSGSR
ncbi:ComEA family DNA-binding protein [Rhodopirellula sp. MGV]|uniref:ComEA family DNA-binding protein n=1 Tax=Rhodopirellula sp. MGV TaxID=2023130 RepID=UPI00130443F5|nr:helix-hairpin-helix domain-containing protein [Rhodopirellula sp. MGV]